MTDPDPRTARASVVAWAVSIAVLVSDPDVLAGRQLPGVALATVAALLLLVGGRAPRSTAMAIGVLDVLALAWTSSPVALLPLLVVALYRLVRRSDDR
ncbi:two-component sensor histidine kinase, partial [cyanobacterium TDX16]